MMKKTITSLLLLLLATLLQAQVPQNFAYQAVLRNAQGQVMASQSASIRVSLLNGSATGEIVYSEIHSVTTSIQGIINLTIGNGSSKIGEFSEIPWNESIFLKVEYAPEGNPAYIDLGTSPILAVPYAIKAGSLAKNPIEVLAPADQNPEEPIFVVKNSTGEVVFAVYETGTRVYVDKSNAKGSRGGFAVGGIGDNLKEGTLPHYLTIEPDSVRFNINQTTKGNRGGFAVGGIGDNLKGLQDYLYIRPDSIRFAVDESLNEKGNRGGFAIGGIGDNLKGFNNYFYVNQDCTYVSNTLNALGNVVVTGNMLMGGTIGVIPTPPVTDLDGNSYQTTRIGNQVWMAENLRATKYNDNTPILPSAALDGSLPYTAYFDGTEFLNPLEWGYLYSLAEINYTDKNICPIGWRLPTFEDWTTLTSTIGGFSNAIDLIDNTPGLWWEIKKSNSKATGFKAKPAGQFDFEAALSYNPVLGNPSFYSLHYQSKFWSQPQEVEGNFNSSVYTIEWMSGSYYLTSYEEPFYEAPEYYRGYSIRCIKE